MDNEKKYDYQGTVTISTDEYRDLISENADLKCELREVSSKKTELYWEADKLKKEVETLKQKCNEQLGFINSSEEQKTKFKLWKLENMERTDEDNE